MVSAICLYTIPILANVPPDDADPIRSDMERIIAFLDSTEYAAEVSWEEHVVLVFQLSLDRNPTALERVLLSSYRDDFDISRSSILSFTLGKDNVTPTWEACRAFLNRVQLTDFQVNDFIKKQVENYSLPSFDEAVFNIVEEERAPLLERRSNGNDTSGFYSMSGDAPFVPYNTYFGYLHAHCELSDGQGSPNEAYAFARDVGNLDFFALTDHGELLDWWPWENKYQKLRDAADANYIPGTFATLYGFEWSSPIFGHINIINAPDYTNSYKAVGLGDIYNWIQNQPDSFARYNHPGDHDDVGQEFLHLALDPGAVPQMVGIENFNGNASFDRYYYQGSWENSFSYWDVGNLEGWRLGALGGQDNHDKSWGTMNEFRTAVLAKELTREAMVDAYKKRRFYVTEDKDFIINFRCQGKPVGSQLTSNYCYFSLEAYDLGGDMIEEIRFYRDGVLWGSATLLVSYINAYVILPTPGSHYYYIAVRQSDDNDLNGRNDEAFTSPIWVN